MAIDRPAREVVLNALLQYMRGETRSYGFDDRITPYFNRKGTADEGLRQIANALWRIYDDFIDHPISVTAEGWEALRRTLAYLQTDLELAKNCPRQTWPFASEQQWHEHQPLAEKLDLPLFDPAIHSRQFRPWWNRIPTSVGVLILLGFLVPVLILLFFFT